MQCPVDNTTLAMAERHGVEIDYCPTCRGVWLDRGELDKIIERAEAEAEAVAPSHTPELENEGGSRAGGHRKRRRSFLRDLFEGD